MATVSFDRKIILKEEDVPAFLTAIESSDNLDKEYYNHISLSDMERNEQLLKQYFCN